MTNSWLSLLPPVLVLLAALKTKNLHFSLILGIISAGFIAANGSLSSAGFLIIKRFYEQGTNTDSLYTYFFLCAIGSIVALLERTGITAAFTALIGQKISSPLKAQLFTVGLSATTALDDYLNTLTAGYVMRPLIDQAQVPRTKLAFLLHAFSGPLVILVPLSSWAGYITGQLSLSGISQDTLNARIIDPSFSVYLLAIPFIIYSLTMICSTLFIITQKISYGPMRYFDQNPKSSLQTQSVRTSYSKNATASDFFITVGVLVVSALIGIMFINTGYSSSFVLCISGAMAFIVGLIVCLLKKHLSYKAIPYVLLSGIYLMIFAIAMVFLASTLGSMLRNDLLAGNYIAHLVSGKLALHLLPAAIFIIALLISTITGSSWGTIALLLPVSIPLLIEITHTQTPTTVFEIPLLLPLLGAIFSGAVCGDQVSPISETTMMVATSAGCSPIEHVHTQFFYTLPVIVSTLIGYLISGYLYSYSLYIQACIPLITALLCSFISIYVINRYTQPLGKKI